MINSHGLQNNVHLLGLKTKDKIIDLLLTSDVFVLSSHAENFSVAVIEALSLGLPCVATLCGGTDECIDESNGILVPTNDIDALSNAIKQIHSNILQYNSENIRESCINKYSPIEIASQLVEIYNKTIYK